MPFFYQCVVLMVPFFCPNLRGFAGKETLAFGKTDKEFIELLEHPNEKVQVAVAARLGVKSTLEETRTENLIGVSERGRLPIMLNYYGAHTGRFSGGDKLNLQNLPARGNNTIRRALKAPNGQVLVACDSSQIEARMVAWVAEQHDLVSAFAQVVMYIVSSHQKFMGEPLPRLTR